MLFLIFYDLHVCVCLFACVCCMKDYDTRVRLATHLVQSAPRCKRFYESTRDPAYEFLFDAMEHAELESNRVCSKVAIAELTLLSGLLWAFAPTGSSHHDHLMLMLLLIIMTVKRIVVLHFVILWHGSWKLWHGELIAPPVQFFFLTRWHARIQGIFEGYLGDIWRTFGGHLEDIWRKFAGNLEDVKRRLEGKNLVFLKPYFLISLFENKPVYQQPEPAS